MMRDTLTAVCCLVLASPVLPCTIFFLSRLKTHLLGPHHAPGLLSCIRAFCFLVYGNTGYTAAELDEEARFRLLLSIYKWKQLVFFLINQKPLRVLTFF
jgi:hypothetical protein